MKRPYALLKGVFSKLNYRVAHMRSVAIASSRGNAVSAYWYWYANFGDQITPLLLRKYGFTPIHESPARARFFATGSILEHVPDGYAGVVLGSGLIHESTRVALPFATVLAVRGALTRERLGCGEEVALGDPGLLSASIMEEREVKRFELGIVPHYIDARNPIFAWLAKRFADDVAIIDVSRPPLAVFSAIDKCRHIISSSLHGLIVADSMGLPNAWCFSGGLKGGRFKFDDYYSSIGITADPALLRGDESLSELLALTSARPVDRIEELKATQDKLWSELRQYM